MDPYYGRLSDYTPLSEPAGRLHHCGRCGTRIKDQMWHCHDCDNYDLCVLCTQNGIYCQNDSHSWSEYILRKRKWRDISGPLSNDLWTTANELCWKFVSQFKPVARADEPKDIFESEHRFINKRNLREILIYTDGACLGNGKSSAQGGCAFVYRPSAYAHNGEQTYAGTVYFPLEDQGPTGKMYSHTSNRAELRAVIAALQFRDWSTDCNRSWRSVVIATDSEYVVLGVTERAKGWKEKGWKLSRGGNVKNIDLWKQCMKEIEKVQKNGVNISFWRIPRTLNARADEFAKKAAAMTGRRDFRVRVPDGPIKIKLVKIS